MGLRDRHHRAHLPDRLAGPRRHRVPLSPHHRIIDTSLGELTLVGEGETLTGLYYPGHRPGPDRAGFGPLDAGVFAEAERQIHEYLAGRRTDFSCAIALPGAGRLRSAVWEAIRAIPYGETRTYRELADRVGSHPRAVGGAVAHNPLSIIVPCHRVLGSAGALTGYAGGLERKRTLLALEAGQRGRSLSALGSD